MKKVVTILAVLILCGCKIPMPSELDDALPPGAVVEPSIPEPGPAVAPGYTITAVTASSISWRGPDFPWPGKGPENLCGEFHVYRADGRGGKLDHIRPNTDRRDWNNMPSYGVWRTVGEPEMGERCEAWAVSYDHNERIFIGSFGWPR